MQTEKTLKMMKYYGFDWLAMVCGFCGMYLVGSKNKYGFVVFMMSSSSWIVVGIMVNSFPLIFGSSMAIALQIRGLLNWNGDKQ